MLILLDSSMLMLPLEKKINLIYEIDRLVNVAYEIVVPRIVLRELEDIMQKEKTAVKRKAQLALNLASSFRILESEIVGIADTELLRLARFLDAIVATNDRELRITLLENSIPVISLHGENKLTLFGDLPF
ncbi:MAG: hypothetical protein KGD64_04925 [Candidatus Heimdallarchaeota archaeon]|nr:hypothetical protein [Candidatus Heimdallarchaeota archaeon]